MRFELIFKAESEKKLNSAPNQLKFVPSSSTTLLDNFVFWSFKPDPGLRVLLMI